MFGVVNLSTVNCSFLTNLPWLILYVFNVSFLCTDDKLTNIGFIEYIN